MTDFYINFISDLSPGGTLWDSSVHKSGSSNTYLLPIGGWPVFEANSRSVMNLQRDNVTVVPDGT